jgi:hypothetical protein
MKLIDPKELSEGGYIQEANRRFFHPLGLALAVLVETDGRYSIAGVIDARGDPEGFSFERTAGELGPKAAAVEAELAARSPARLAALGYIVQPAGAG